MAAADPRRTGRPPGSSAAVTRRHIIDAAQRLFATSDLTSTSMRAIAREAGVDPALLHRHFASKQELFLAAHQIPDDPALLLGPALEAEPHDRAAVLTRTFLTRFLDGEHPVGLSLIRSAATDPTAAKLLRDTLETALVGRAEQLTDRPDARARVAIAAGILVGIVFHRGILGIEAITGLQIDGLCTLATPAIQAVLDPGTGDPLDSDPR